MRRDAKPHGPLTEAQRRLVADNHNLIYGFAHKRRLSVDDWYDILAATLCRAAQSYDPARGAFSTWFYNLAGFAVQKEFARLSRDPCGRRPVSLEMLAAHEQEPAYTEPGFAEVEAEERCERVRERIGVVDRAIMDALAAGMQQAEIARIMGVSRAAISRRVKRIRRKEKHE